MTAEGRDLIVAPWAALEEVTGRWAASLRADERAETTVTGYVRSVVLFARWCEEHGVAHVSAQTVMEWREDMLTRYARASVGIWLSGLKKFFAWAVENGLVGHDPAETVGLPRRDKGFHKRDALSEGEMRRVLDLPDPGTPDGCRDLAILTLMAYCASRAVELYRANFEDLYEQDGKLILRVQGKGKVEKSDVYVLLGETRAAMDAWVAHRGEAPGPLFVSLTNRTKAEHLPRLSLRSIARVAEKYMTAAGASSRRKTMHSLRHTAINQLLRSGGSLLEARQLARHQNINTTLIYVHETDRVSNPVEAKIHYRKVEDE